MGAQRCTADAALHRARQAEQLAQAGTGAGADIAFGLRLVGSRFAGGPAGRGIGPRAARQPQVEQHRRRHDGHPRRPHRQALALCFQPAHHAAGRVQAEGAAAAEQQRMHPVHQVVGVQQVGLAGARRGAAHVGAGHRAAGRAQHHAATGGVGRQRVVADPQAGHVGQMAWKAGAWSLHPATVAARRRRATRPMPARPSAISA